MNSLRHYIAEKFQVSKDNIRRYVYYPKNKAELIECIKEKIDKEGLGTEDKPLDLNDIDTSEITDMGLLFDALDGKLKDLSKNGYFDISDWDVSNVKNMEYMFYDSNFTGDISNWNLSNVKSMGCMFRGSKFTGKNGDISRWDVRNVSIMSSMFHDSSFDGDISNWKVQKYIDIKRMFHNCPLEKNPPKWYKI